MANFLHIAAFEDCAVAMNSLLSVIGSVISQSGEQRLSKSNLFRLANRFAILHLRTIAKARNNEKVNWKTIKTVINP
jgi:hypothetical protein